MFTPKFTVIAVTAVVLAVAPGLATPDSGTRRGAPVQYTIVDLGTLGGSTSVALDINDYVQVVGSADMPDGKRHACLWQDGEITDLGTLGVPDAQSEAWGINNFSQVVGILTGSGAIGAAFIWEGGEMAELGDPAIPKSAFAINDAGQVVGTAIFPPPVSEQHAFLYENGVLTDISVLGFASGTAWDISSDGAVVGGSTLWQAGKPTDLGTLGGNVTAALGLNDHRQVVGKSERVAGKVIFHAFLWQHGEMTDLGAIGGFYESTAWAVNSSGQVIGSGYINTETAGSVEAGFLYDPLHGVIDLLATLPDGSGWSQLRPRNINNAGQIVGAGTVSGWRHAFLMTPTAAVPALSARGALALVLLFAIVGPVFGSWIRRRSVRKC